MEKTVEVLAGVLFGDEQILNVVVNGNVTQSSSRGSVSTKLTANGSFALLR